MSESVAAPRPITVSLSEIEDDSPSAMSCGRIGMFCLIIAESAIFAIFVVAYVFYLGRSLSGPTPRDVLEVPVVNTICLLSSSATISMAMRSLRKGQKKRFVAWWSATLVLGIEFLVGTGLEWGHLIQDAGLTISTNLFGTTYFSLVGLHAAHVLVGLALLLVVLLLALRKAVGTEHADRVEVLALYWHFVDVIWVVVFTVVYLVGR
jgi:cytochrome c oxidase subunit III